jgi:hypothetical protein
MIDVLAVLDRAIDELRPEDASDTACEKWQKSSKLPVASVSETATVTPNPLNKRELPALPVVPVPKQKTYELSTENEKKTNGENQSKKVSPHEYVSKSAGSTGSTGSFEGFCGQNTTREGYAERGVTGITGSCKDFRGSASDRDPMGTYKERPKIVEPAPRMPNSRRAHRSSADYIPAVWGEAQEERAAIVQHDGEIPRAWAEGFARLDPDNPPACVPPKRWVRFIDNVGAFLDSPFCAVAAALSWGPLDLFGCDRDAPLASIDRAGLLWLLDGARLLMLVDDAAMVETQTGVRGTWRRTPAEPGRVLAWELAR